MTSRTTKAFRQALAALLPEVRRNAGRAYTVWKSNPRHPSLHIKQFHSDRAIWSVRIGLGWRALGVISGDSIIWFWIGSHSDYDRLIGG